VRNRVGTTTGNPRWWVHGRAAWDAWPCVPSALGLLHFPSCLFIFPRNLSVLPAILPFKMNVFGSLFRDLQFHSFHHSSSSFKIRVVLERKGVEEKIARISGRVCGRKIQARFFTKLSFPSLLFSHFRFIFYNLT